MSNNSLTVCNTSIRQDADGRYFLNDLHKASGGHQKDRPVHFLENKGTQDLIAEIIAQEIPTSDRINNLAPVKTVNSFTEQQGTYVIKPLVYYYAMWISPKFQLHVINAYDALVTNHIPGILNPITEPLSVEDFKWRYEVLSNALNHLKNAQVVTVMTGAQLMSKPMQATLFPEKPLPNQAKGDYKRSRLWSDQDIAQLKGLYQAGFKYKEIAEKLNRTLEATRYAIHLHINSKVGA